jgi:hypothetical protein
VNARRIFVAGLLGVGLSLSLPTSTRWGASLAQAQDLELSDAEKKSYRSGQNFGFSLHFGPYRPNVDSEFGGQRQEGPYQLIFGSGSKLLSQADFEYQFLHTFGIVAAGLSAGYFSVTGKSLRTNFQGEESNDDSRLRLFPLAASLIYRLSVTNDRYGVPLIPYAKAGFDYVIWAVNDGNGKIVSDGNNGKARGGTLGWHATLGLSLVLDFMDPDAAHEFDSDTGVNHTHLFFEYTKATVNGLGESHKLRVGDTTWNMGLLFEF